MYNYAVSQLQTRSEAEDAVQEAFLKMLRRERTDDIENGRAYYKDTNKSSADFVVGKVVPGAKPTAVDAE